MRVLVLGCLQTPPQTESQLLDGWYGSCQDTRADKGCPSKALPLTLKRFDLATGAPLTRPAPAAAAQPEAVARTSTEEPLITPALLSFQVPVPSAVAANIAKCRATVSACIAGRDDRLVVVVGPCSIHDVAAATEYAGRLKQLASELGNELVVVMRT